MTNLIVFIIFGILVAIIMQKDIEDVLPVYLCTFLVCLYGIAVLGYAHHSFDASVLGYIVIYVVFVFSNYKRNSNIPGVKRVTSSLIPNKPQLESTFKNPVPVGFILYFIMVLVMFYCYSTHFVNVWDDFHFNATLAKDMYYFGTMPKGYQHTTMYKDYFPTQQLFFYWGFQGMKGFSEPLMFQYKLFMAYTLMLPIFKEVNSGHIVKRISAGVLACVMPIMCLFETLESLSMDTVLALIFANVLYRIIFSRNRERKIYDYYAITITLMALVLYKSYALMFAGIALGILLFDEAIPLKEINRKKIIRYAVVVICTLGAYLSWRIFCKVFDNTTYLSVILLDNIKSGKGVVFPEYARETVINLLKSIFTLKLNFGTRSITVFISIVLFVVASFVMKKCGKYDIKSLWTDIIFMAGFLVFYLFLVYTYLFIFETYEALELTSIDRYLGSYVLVVVYVTACKLILACKPGTESVLSDEGLVNVNEVIQRSADEPESRTNRISYICLGVFAVYCLFTLNYSLLAGALIPSKYMENRNDIYEIKKDVEHELSGINFNDYYGGRIMVVFDKDNCMYSRTMEYDMIPLKTYLTVTSKIESEDFAETLIQNIKNNNTGYVYFSNQFLESDKGADMLQNLAEAGVISSVDMIEAGKLYSYDEELGMIK